MYILPEIITIIPAAIYNVLCPVCTYPLNFEDIIAWQRTTRDEIWQTLKKYLSQKLPGNIVQTNYKYYTKWYLLKIFYQIK